MGSRHWCWTLHLDKDTDWYPNIDHENHRYTVAQWEKKTHWQGYTELNEPMRRDAFKEWIGYPQAHVEPRKGSRSEARAYCMKDDSRTHGPYEFGKWNKAGQGNRTDHDNVAKEIKENGLDKAIDTYPGHYLRFHGGMEKLATHYNKNRRRKVSVSYGDYEDGMYCFQGGDSLREQFAGYMGEETIYVPDGIGRPHLEKGLPMFINNTWARWTHIVYDTKCP